MGAPSLKRPIGDRLAGEAETGDMLVSVTTVSEMSLPRLLLMHLAPGGLTALAFLALAGPVEAAGFPPIFALFIASAALLIPFQLLVVAHAERDAPLRGGWFAAVRYREPISARGWLLLFPATLIATMVAFVAASVLDAPIRDTIFAWYPEPLRNPLPLNAMGDYTPAAWLVVVAGLVLVFGLAVPTAEEVYFRGYLLPRMERFGAWAPLMNVVLFSLYHFWSPWQFLARIAGALPWTYAAWWKRNVYLAVAVHVTANTVGSIPLILVILNGLDG
jgi:uncharacterized protein